MSCAEVHLSRDQVRSASGQPIPMSVADPICPEGADGILSRSSGVAQGRFSHRRDTPGDSCGRVNSRRRAYPGGRSWVAISNA